MISEYLVSAFLALKERQTVTKIDDIFKEKRRKERERENAGAQGWPDHFSLLLVMSVSHLGM